MQTCWVFFENQPCAVQRTKPELSASHFWFNGSLPILTKCNLSSKECLSFWEMWCFSVVWFAVGWFDFVFDLKWLPCNVITLTIACAVGESHGADPDPVSCQGRRCPVFNLLNSVWMQYRKQCWSLFKCNTVFHCQCFTRASASHFEQELVLWPLLSNLPPSRPTLLLQLIDTL